MPLRVLSLIPLVAGAASVLFGAALMPDAGDAGPSVESELRFYGAWWLGAGLFLQWVANDLPGRTHLLLPFAALLALGATGRLIGIVADGRPHAQFLALMVVEYVVAAGLTAFAARRRGRGRSREASSAG